MGQYQAIQINTPGQLEVVQRESKELEPGTLRLRVEAVGICASDVAVLQGSHPFARYPVISGHEIAGVVAEAKGSLAFQVGQRVAVEPMVPCGQCNSCRHGHPNRCHQVQVMGIQIPGGMAEQMVVSESQLHLIPDELDAEQAAMIEPMAVAVHVCNRSMMKAGDRVSVVGTGKIGLLVLAVAGARGAEALFGVDIVEERLRHAEAMGASATALVPSQPVEEMAAKVAPEGFDVVFDTAGDPESLALATKLARPGGTVVPVALPHAGLPMDFRNLYRKELTIRAARMYTDEFEEAAQLLTQSKVDPRSLITHRLPLEQAQSAFELAANRPEEAVKVIVQVSDPQTYELSAASTRESIHE